MPVFTDDRLRPRFDAERRPLVRRQCSRCSSPTPAGAARIVLTERLTYDGHHSGEVSLPGGKAEPADAGPAETALREAAEEVGLDAARAGVRIVGAPRRGLHPGQRLPDHPSRRCRRPPATLTPEPGRGRPHPRAARRRVPAGAPVEIVERVIRDWPLRYGGYRIDGLHVWGATARILGQLGRRPGSHVGIFT